MLDEQPFPAAQWRHLAMVNVEIDPRVLQPLVPYGTVESLTGSLSSAFLAEGSDVAVFKNVPLDR